MSCTRRICSRLTAGLNSCYQNATRENALWALDQVGPAIGALANFVAPTNPLVQILVQVQLRYGLFVLRGRPRAADLQQLPTGMHVSRVVL